MFLGALIGQKQQIYIKGENVDGTVFLSFDKVEKDTITRLNEKEANKIIDLIFNTQKKYIESKNGYEIYIDENNLKRYYKDGKEDFNMFYFNNGREAILYSEGKKNIKNIRTKIIAKILYGTTFLILSSPFVALVADKITDGKSTIAINTTINTTIASTKGYKEADVDTLKNYIATSSELNDFDRDLLSNDNYFSFLMNRCGSDRKLWDFNDRFKNMNIKTFTASEKENYGGYYSYGENTLHILDTIMDDIDSRKNVETHEFIHLTQTCKNYNYILEALAEIMSYEFYNQPNTSYIETQKRIYILMELIGPEPVFNAVYSNDTSFFENTIRMYLSESDTKEFLKLMEFYQWDYIYGDNLEKDNNRCIDDLLRKIIQKKYELNHDEEERKANEFLMEQVISGNLPKKFYFNDKDPRFYIGENVIVGKQFIEKFDGDYTEGYDNEIIYSKGTPNTIQIDSVEYTKDNFMYLMDMDNEYNLPSKFIDFIKKFGWIDFNINNSDGVSEKKCSYEFLEESRQLKKVYYNSDGEPESSYTLNTDEQIVSDIKNTLSASDISSIKLFRGNKQTTFNWSKGTIDSYSIFLSNYKYTGTLDYDDCIGYLNTNEISFYKKEVIQIPSTYDKFSRNISLKKINVKYGFLKQTINEIIDYEVKGDLELVNKDGVKNTRNLMEIIGPQIVVDAACLNKYQKLEETIYKYFDKDKGDRFLQLLTFDDWDNKKGLTEVNGELNQLINDLNMAKQKADNNIDEYRFNREIIYDNLKDENIDRFYINKNDERYYKDYIKEEKYTYESTPVYGDYDETLILSKGTPEKVKVNNLYYKKERLVELLNNSKFINILINNPNFHIKTYSSSENMNIINYNFRIKEDGTFEVKCTTDSENSMIYTINNDEVEFRDFMLQLINKNNNDNFDFDLIYEMDWNEFKSNEFLIDAKMNAVFTYDENNFAIFRSFGTKKPVTIFREARKLQIPSISKKFGENPEQEISIKK